MVCFLGVKFMRLISFDPYRSMGIPEVEYIKPELFFAEQAKIEKADWVLFPEYWQVNALSYALKKRIFPSLSTYHLGHNKIEMTRAIQAVMPHNFPQTLIRPAKEEVWPEAKNSLGLPIIAKEVRSSCGRGIELLENISQYRSYINNREIVYLQEYLPLDRDLRVVIVGKEVLLSYWRINPGHLLHNVAQGGEISFTDIPQEVVDLVLQLAHKLNIDHAGFDVGILDGHPYIWEFNVMFGNQGLLQQKVNVAEKIYQYLSSFGFDDPNLPDPLLPQAS